MQADLREFFVVAKQFLIADHVRKYEGWRSSLAEWRTIDAVDDTARSVEGINPYNLFLIFASQVKPLSKIFIDTGCSIAWAMQAAKFSQEHTVFHDFNNTAMGWALPASVGSLVADLSVAHYCIIGDGGFMMTIQELSMVAHHKLPLKIIVINNSGYSMIKQTQEQWFDNDYVASGIDDISFPEFETIALGFGISFIRLSDPEEITTTLNYVNECDGPVMCEVIISPDARVIPQVKAGRANEDMEPLLPRNVFNDAMLICPESRSR